MIAKTVFLLFICAGLRSWANFANYNSVLIGDQSAGMGGAATAMLDDSSGMAWYNPAGLAKLRGQSFSAAVGIYKKFDTRYRDDGDFAKASLKVNQGFFRALPSSTASVIRPKQFEILDKYTLALSILVPEYESFKGDIAYDGASISSLNLITESIWVGGAIAKRVSETESMGLTVYYTARNVAKSVYDRTYITATQSQIFTEERNLTQNGIVPILGYHKDFGPNWKLGVSYRFNSFHVAGTGEVNQAYIDNGTISILANERSLESETRIPWKATVGIAYKVPRSWVWALDVSTYGGQYVMDVERNDIAEKIESRPIWNVSTGLEIEWKPWLKTRAGIFSNYSAHPDPDPAKVQGQADHVDQAGFSANLAFRQKNLEYTFGGYYTGGRGRSVQRVNQRYEVVTKIQNVFTMLVGTNYSF